MCTALLAFGGVRERAAAQELAAAVYVRTDSDQTTVVAPRLRAQIPLGESSRLSAIYAVDVWTSASIDIRTSASQVPVTEQRDEIDVAYDHEFEDVNLTVAYRYSTEPDYVSHGGSGGFSYDFADNNATVALGVSGSSDQVGKAGDPEFSKPSATLGGRFSFTQVLTSDALLQLMYEVSRATGYLASPYRYVPIAGAICTTSVVTEAPGRELSALCPLEVNPGERLRHAIALELRYALTAVWSAGAAYRYYLDDWGIISHTLRADLTYAPSDDTLLAARYRFYTQGAADHYRARYDVPQPFVTSDKELSPLSAHRVALEFDHVFDFAGDQALTGTLSFAPIFYSYTDFIPLDHITAYEVNLALVYVP